MGKRPGSGRLGIGLSGGGFISSTAPIAARPPATRHRTTPPAQPSAPLPPQPSSSSAPSSGTAYPGSRRGCPAAALAASEESDSMDAAVAALLRDRYAPNTNRARASWQRTWLKFHLAAHRHVSPSPPPFPPTPSGLQHIAALFKAGGYRSLDRRVTRCDARCNPVLRPGSRRIAAITSTRCNCYRRPRPPR